MSQVIVKGEDGKDYIVDLEGLDLPAQPQQTEETLIKPTEELGVGGFETKKPAPERNAPLSLKDVPKTLASIAMGHPAVALAELGLRGTNFLYDKIRQDKAPREDWLAKTVEGADALRDDLSSDNARLRKLQTVGEFVGGTLRNPVKLADAALTAALPNASGKVLANNLLGNQAKEAALQGVIPGTAVITAESLNGADGNPLVPLLAGVGASGMVGMGKSLLSTGLLGSNHKEIIRDAGGYLKENPQAILKALQNAKIKANEGIRDSAFSNFGDSVLADLTAKASGDVSQAGRLHTFLADVPTQTRDAIKSRLAQESLLVPPGESIAPEAAKKAGGFLKQDKEAAGNAFRSNLGGKADEPIPPAELQKLGQRIRESFSQDYRTQDFPPAVKEVLKAVEVPKDLLGSVTSADQLTPRRLHNIWKDISKGTFTSEGVYKGRPDDAVKSRLQELIAPNLPTEAIEAYAKARKPNEAVKQQLNLAAVSKGKKQAEDLPNTLFPSDTIDTARIKQAREVYGDKLVSAALLKRFDQELEKVYKTTPLNLSERLQEGYKAVDAMVGNGGKPFRDISKSSALRQNIDAGLDAVAAARGIKDPAKVQKFKDDTFYRFLEAMGTTSYNKLKSGIDEASFHDTSQKNPVSVLLAFHSRGQRKTNSFVGSKTAKALADLAMHPEGVKLITNIALTEDPAIWRNFGTALANSTRRAAVVEDGNARSGESRRTILPE